MVPSPAREQVLSAISTSKHGTRCPRGIQGSSTWQAGTSCAQGAPCVTVGAECAKEPGRPPNVQGVSMPQGPLGLQGPLLPGPPAPLRSGEALHPQRKGVQGKAKGCRCSHRVPTLPAPHTQAEAGPRLKAEPGCVHRGRPHAPQQGIQPAPQGGRCRTSHLGRPKCSRDLRQHHHTGHCLNARVAWKQDGNVGGDPWGGRVHGNSPYHLCDFFL